MLTLDEYHEKVNTPYQSIIEMSKGNPGIFRAKHDLSNGDYVFMETPGIWQIDNGIFRVCSVIPDQSFQLEATYGKTGIDTTDFDDLNFGRFRKLVFIPNEDIPYEELAKIKDSTTQ